VTESTLARNAPGAASAEPSVENGLRPVAEHSTTRSALKLNLTARPTAFWIGLSLLATLTAGFVAWTGVAVGTALALLAVFALLFFKPPQNMMEGWVMSAPLWVTALGVIAAVLVFTRPPSMPSIQSYLMHAGLRVAVDQNRKPDDFAALRRPVDVAATRKPRLMDGVAREVVNTPTVKGEWLVRTGSAPSGAAILWMHGGHYVSGHPATTRPIAMDMARKTGVPVFSLEYRLAPEAPYPAALDDVKAAYAWLIEKGFKHERIFVGGESSGAGLAIALALSLKADGAGTPAGLIAVSPWVDLAGTGESMTTRAADDAMLSPDFLRAAATAYAGGDLRNVLVSPLYGDLTGLPPMIVQDGGDSILVDDSKRLVEQATAQGVAATLDVWPGAPHMATSLFMFLPEGRRSLAKIEVFIQARLKQR
jgi:acetyl esterase/lipase